MQIQVDNVWDSWLKLKVVQREMSRSCVKAILFVSQIDYSKEQKLTSCSQI